MSMWTHVTCSFSLDMSSKLAQRPDDVDRIFGKVLTFDDIWDRRYSVDKSVFMSPSGSEGTLERVVINPREPSCLHDTLVVYDGDLRDVSSHKPIRDWFTACVEHYSPMIRNASMNCYVESGEGIMMSFSDGILRYVEYVDYHDDETESYSKFTTTDSYYVDKNVAMDEIGKHWGLL